MSTLNFYDSEIIVGSLLFKVGISNFQYSKFSKKGWCEIFYKNGSLAKRRDIIKRGGMYGFFDCLEYTADVAIHELLAELELIGSFIYTSFLPLLLFLFNSVGFRTVLGNWEQLFWLKGCSIWRVILRDEKNFKRGESHPSAHYGNVFSCNLITINLEYFPNHGGIYSFEKKCSKISWQR